MSSQKIDRHAAELARNVGAAVVDQNTGATAQLMAIATVRQRSGQEAVTLAFLRPASGGVEWTAPPSRVRLCRPPDQTEAG